MSTRFGATLLPAALAAAFVLTAGLPAPAWAQSNRRFLEPPSNLPRIQQGTVNLDRLFEALKVAPLVAIAPTGEEVQLAQVVTPPPAEPEVAVAVAEKVLPDTASSLPLIALFGLVALGGAFALRVAERRV